MVWQRRAVWLREVLRRAVWLPAALTVAQESWARHLLFPRDRMGLRLGLQPRIPTMTAAGPRGPRPIRVQVPLGQVRARPARLARAHRVPTVRLSAAARWWELRVRARTRAFAYSTKKSTTTNGNSFTIRPRIEAAS